jgi:8-oxo-dGTP pyrophosphatase MutT (NUDIX family)
VELNINAHGRLTSADIRQRLSGTESPKDPATVLLPPGRSIWTELMREFDSGALTPAGVLIPIIEREAGSTVLLTQRAANLKHHAGQVSFPGGRMEDSDVDIAATALRETHEEVGIAPDAVSVAGFLRTMPTITGYAVTPVVGFVRSGTQLQIDHGEVEYTFEVPLSFLFDESNDLQVTRDVFKRQVTMTEFFWEGQRIWGATAYMILSLRKALLN